MATATERAAVGAEEARMEGRGPGGQVAEAARNVATGRDQPGGLHNNGVGAAHDGIGPVNGRTTVGERGLLRDHHHGGHGEFLGNTEEEMARLRLKTHITHEGDAYCPNPNIRDLVSSSSWNHCNSRSALYKYKTNPTGLRFEYSLFEFAQL